MLPRELETYFSYLPEGWENSPVGRRTACEEDPLAWAFVYMRSHLKLQDTDIISFAEIHSEWARYAKSWMNPATIPSAHRDVFIAPRGCGKSTWFFLLLPLWAACYGYVKFAAAFAHRAEQAEQHLMTFKAELERNELLRNDFPELCTPATRPRGSTIADNRAMLQTSSGFVFAARGVDSGNLGLKVGNLRPDLIICDDIEPDESSYSPYQATKRLSTLNDAVLQLNVFARVVWVGTVTMAGSLIHQLSRSVNSTEEPEDWIRDERWAVHYSPAILVNDDGSERSLWPEKWSIDFLHSIRHTTSYAKNYANLPVSRDGAYWTPDQIITVPAPDHFSLTMLSIDPAVTTKTTSDFTGIALLGWDKPTNKVYVRAVWKVKLSGMKLKAKVAEILGLYPEIGVLLCETNQGGDLWQGLFGSLPVRYLGLPQSVKKEVRGGILHTGYQKRQVLHTAAFPELETELLAFPHGLNDDLTDAVGSGYNWLCDPTGKRKSVSRFRATSRSYAE